MVRQLVTDPGAFMESNLQGRSLKLEATVVALVGVLGAIGPLYLAQQLFGEVEDVTYLEFVMASEVLQPVLIAFAAWFGYSAIAQFLANRMNALSPYKRLLRVTAWAMIPLGVGYLIRSVSIIASTQMNPPEIDAQAAGSADEVVRIFIVEGVFAEPIVIGATVVLLGTIVWTGYLVAHAVEQAKGLEHGTALKIAAVPVAIHALFVIRHLIQMLTI